MRKMKIFLSLVVVLLLCASLTACADEKNSNSSDAQQDAVEIHDDDVQLDAVEIHDDDPQGNPAAGNHDDPIHHDEATDNDPMNGDGEENLGMHEGYYHEIGDAWFYTEHDLDKYITTESYYIKVDGVLTPRTQYVFDLDALLTDVWCETGGGFVSNSVGYSYSDGNDFTKGMWFEAPNSDNEKLRHTMTVVYEIDGIEYRTSMHKYDCPRPDSGYYALNTLNIAIHPDMAPLILYTLEQMESNPRNDVLSELPLNDNFECN